MKKQPLWRRIRRYITRRFLGYVNAQDFGLSEDNEDNTEELQAAMDYCQGDGGFVQMKEGTYDVKGTLR